MFSSLLPGQRRRIRGARVQSEGSLHRLCLHENIEVVQISCCLEPKISTEEVSCLTVLLLPVLSAAGDIRHYQIKVTDTGQYFLAEKHTFSSIPDVIHYHEHNAAGRDVPGAPFRSTVLQLPWFLCAGLVSRLRYAVGPMGRCLPATSGFSSGKQSCVLILFDGDEVTMCSQLNSLKVTRVDLKTISVIKCLNFY